MPQDVAQLTIKRHQPSRWLIVGFAAAHFVGAVFLFIVVIGLGMDAFDDSRPPSLILRLANKVLMFWCLPLISPILKLHIRLPVLLQWLTFFGNSFVWGWAAWYLLLRFQARRAAA